MTLFIPPTLSRKSPISSVLSRKRDRWRKNTARIVRQEQAANQARSSFVGRDSSRHGVA